MAVPYVALNTTSVSGASTYTYTFTHAVPVGDGFAVALELGGTTPPAASTITDTKGNIWFLTEASATGTSPYIAVFTCDVKVALTTSDTFTLTFTGNTTGGFGVIAFGVAGQPAIDVRTATATGTSTAPSVTATVASTGTTAVSISGWASTGLTGTTSAPFTRLAQSNPSGFLTVAYDSAPATGSLTSASVITSAAWRATMIVFKAAAPVYMSNAAYINNMDGSNHTLTAQFFAASQNFSINNTANSITSLPAGYSTTPVLKYISYGQFWADVTGSSQTVGSTTYTPVSGGIAGGYSWLMYDTEDWSPNPPSPYAKAEDQVEIDDPWTYMANFVTLAHAHSYKVILPPGRDLGNDATSVNPKLGGETLDAWYLRTKLPGTGAAAGAEVCEVQGQSDEATLTSFYSLWSQSLQQIRSSGATAKAFVGVSTATGTAAQMAAAAQDAANTADGYWLNALTTSTAVSFLSLMAASGGVTVTVSPSTLPGGTVGSAYSQTETASGGTAPYTFAVTSGALPAGTSLNTSTGVISGTPTTSATYSFTITATDSLSNSGSQAYSVTISPVLTGGPYLIGSTAAASGGSTNLTVNVTTTSNNLDTILVGVLVTVAGVTPSVTDTAGNNYSLTESDTVNAATQLWIFESDGSSPLISGTDHVTVAYSANTSNQGAIVVGDNGTTGHDRAVIAHGTSTAPSSGSSGVLSQASEHAIAFIVDTNAGGTPTWAAPWSTHVLGNITSNSATKLSAAYQVVNATTALTASGTITSATWACGEVTTAVAPVSVLTVMSSGVANEVYSQTLEAFGGTAPYTWSVSGTLPTGVTRSAGVISGTPTVAGTYTFTTTATDANSVTGSSVQTITILASEAASSAPALALPNNLLTLEDSDFESNSSTFTWAADVNTGTVAFSAKIALTGAHSLRWFSAADGLTSIHTGFYPVQPGQPYIVSGYLLPCGQRDCQIGVEWYTAGGTLIRTDLSVDNPSSTIAWQPLAAAVTSPVTATQAKIVALVQESNAGDCNHIDLVYFAQAESQVLIDWENPTFIVGGAAGNDFMDVSPFVRMDTGITLTHGRQDSISEIQPGAATLTLQNDTGAFTRNKNASLITVLGGDITLQRRIQINLADENGVWSTRFDGSLSEIDYTFDNTGNTSQLNIAASDVLAYLNRQDALSCWTKEQVLLDGPSLHWTCDDSGNAAGTGVCAESSGNNGPPLRLWNSDNSKTATVGFQDTSGGVETLADAVNPGRKDGSEFWSAGSDQPNGDLRGLDSGTVGPYTTPLGSVYFVPKLTAQASQGYYVGNTGYQLQATLPPNQIIAPNALGTDYSIECWFTIDPAVATNFAGKYGPYNILSLGTSRLGTCVLAGVQLTGGGYNLGVALFNQPPAFLGKNWPGTAPPTVVHSLTAPGPGLSTGSGSNGMDTVNIPHHLVMTITGDPSAPTLTGYLDGVAWGASITLSTRQYFDTIVVGGAFGGTGCHNGGVQLVSIYPYALSAQTVTQHTMLGQYGMWEQTTDDCVATLASFANIPAFWNNLQGKHNGLSLTEYQDIAGTNALANMQLYEQAEHGLLYTDTTGTLNFHTRDWRMGYGPPDLILPPDTFDASMGYQLIDQFMQNEMGVATQVYQTGSSFVNTASQQKYGVYATNSVSSPLQVPLITWNRAFGALGLTSFYYFPDPNLDDVSAWNANAHADPYLTPGQLTVDLLTLSSNTGLQISDFYALEIDNVIAPGGTLPASFPDVALSTEWFIEGISENISQTQRQIQFYCSPAEVQRAWIPGDATYGVLGTTARIGISATDTNVVQADGKDVSHDGGEPYWPPTFSGTMNNPAANGHEFIGASDLRGIAHSLNRILNPPMACVSAQSKTQSVTNGSISAPQIFWDVVHVDTEGGMGLTPGWPNWYTVTVPGYYDIDGCLVWNTGTTGGNMGQGWIVVAQGAAQAVAAGTGDPTTVGQYVCPIGESPRFQGVGMNNTCNPTTRLYLGLGDMVTIAAEQNMSTATNTGTNLGGSHFSLYFTGYGTLDDRVQINTAINGGTVSVGGGGGGGGKVSFTKTYHNTHTYSYYGFAINMDRRNTDGDAYQGTYSGGRNVTGSESSQVVFDHATIQSDLSAPNTTITSVTLTCQNKHTWYNSGGKLMLGYSTQTPGGSTFDANSVSNRDVFEESFTEGQTKTFTLTNAFATTFQGSGKFFVVGDSRTEDLNKYGYWAGGPSSWTLVIKYTVG